jgi:hypothetical protein
MKRLPSPAHELELVGAISSRVVQPGRSIVCQSRSAAKLAFVERHGGKSMDARDLVMVTTPPAGTGAYYFTVPGRAIPLPVFGACREGSLPFGQNMSAAIIAKTTMRPIGTRTVVPRLSTFGMLS